MKPEHLGMCSRRLSRADNFIRQKIEAGQLPGAVTFVMRKGDVVHRNVQGWSNIEQKVPLEEDSLFRIYSMTKIIASVALLALYEAGSLDLCDPVSKFIPEFTEQMVRQADGTLAAAETPITVYDLLRHCSGLDRTIAMEDLLASDYTLETFAQEQAKAPLIAQPGTRWIYGYSTDIIARIIEVISGQTFDQFLDDILFKPLKMTDTGFSISDSQAARLSLLYHYGKDGQLTILDGNGKDRLFGRPKGYLSGSAGLISSPRDYLRFSSMLLNRGQYDGERILGRKTVELMTLDHLPKQHSNLRIGNQSFRFGLGVSVMTDVAASRCLSSIGEYGWGGAAGTQVWINPEEEMIVLIMIQVRSDVPTGIMDVYKRLVYQALID